MDLNERQVRERAYFIWENEGRVFGRAEAHWLQAEAELSRRAAAPLRVETVAEAIRLASPAEVLKPRATRAKAAAKVALTDVAAPAKAADKAPAAKKAAAPKAKSTVAKSTVAKSTVAKSAAPKPAATKAAKAASRTARAEAAAGVSLH